MKPNLPCQCGDRIELIAMPNDPDPIPAGATGTVVTIIDRYDGTRQIVVDWDNCVGRSLNLELPEDHFRVTPIIDHSELVYLTNGGCEVTDVTPEVLDAANLPYRAASDGGNDWYPLTTVEEKVIAEDEVQSASGSYGGTGYTVLYKGGKWIAITFENTYSLPEDSVEQAKAQSAALAQELIPVARAFGGQVAFDSDPHTFTGNGSVTGGMFTTSLLIPMEYPIKHCGFDFERFKLELEALLQKTPLGSAA